MEEQKEIYEAAKRFIQEKYIPNSMHTQDEVVSCICEFCTTKSISSPGDVIDINGSIIKIGDSIKWNYLYWSEGSSEDFFGTEPQNSYNVVEAYIDNITSEVILSNGAMCVKYGKKILSLKEIIETLPDRFKEFAMIYEGDELDVFLNESVFKDRAATIEEVKTLFSKFEIV